MRKLVIVLILAVQGFGASAAPIFAIEVDGFNLPQVYNTQGLDMCPQFAVYLRYIGDEALNLKAIEFNLLNYFAVPSSAEVSKFVGSLTPPVPAITRVPQELDTTTPFVEDRVCNAATNSANLGLTEELFFAQNAALPFDSGESGTRVVLFDDDHVRFLVESNEPVLRVAPGGRYLVAVVTLPSDTDFVSGTEFGGVASRVVDTNNVTYLGGDRGVTTGVIESDGGFVFLSVVGHSPSRFRAEDSDFSGRIELDEMLRVIQLYNADHYRCMDQHSGVTEDGVQPSEEPESPSGPKFDCYFHTADRDGDWQISLSELLRSIQVFSLGGYTSCEEGVDGFCLQAG